MEVQEITLFDNVTPTAITSSTDATPVVITATSHGLVTGDRVLIYGHTTNIAANGIFKVTKVDANSFSIQDELTGANVAGSGAGAGASGICVKAPPVLLAKSFRNIELQVNMTGTPTCTLKVAGSDGKPASVAQTSPRFDYPNLGASVSASNPYTFLQVIDSDTGTAYNGATGIVATAADLAKSYEININLKKYITVFPISWTQGAITVKAILKNNY